MKHSNDIDKHTVLFPTVSNNSATFHVLQFHFFVLKFLGDSTLQNILAHANEYEYE